MRIKNAYKNASLKGKASCKDGDQNEKIVDL
jgi:hypothetical protein